MIRQANPADAPQIARLIILAMDDLAAKFIGTSDNSAVIPVFERFAALPANQYSYENILVYEDEEEVCGMISAYDGADLELLRAPFLDYLKINFDFSQNIEDETEKGEYYIDCLSVLPDRQGKGIGKILIKSLIERAIVMNLPVVGLLVSKSNPKAASLYQNLGFKVVNERVFMGGSYFHMQMETAYDKH